VRPIRARHANCPTTRLQRPPRLGSPCCFAYSILGSTLTAGKKESRIRVTLRQLQFCGATRCSVMMDVGPTLYWHRAAYSTASRSDLSCFARQFVHNIAVSLNMGLLADIYDGRGAILQPSTDCSLRTVPSYVLKLYIFVPFQGVLESHTQCLYTPSGAEDIDADAAVAAVIADFLSAYSPLPLRRPRPSPSPS